nr:MAG TPA: tail assembly chaperone protein [Caudoviricetes sp.]
MILSINGRDFNLIFGLAFLREINKLHSAELEGMNDSIYQRTRL